MSYTYCDPVHPYCQPRRTGDPMWQYPRTAAPIPSVAEQMGTDPISKLAAAIEKLADALKADGIRD